MKIKSLFIYLALLIGMATGSAQNRVSLNLTDRPAEEVFRQIESLSGYHIFCDPAEIAGLSLTITCQDLSAEEALKQALEGTALLVSVFEDRYLFVSRGKQLLTEISADYSAQQMAQTAEQETTRSDAQLNPLERRATSENRVYTIGNESIRELPERVTLNGMITDFGTGEPIVGVVVYTEDMRYTASTDAFGYYSIQLPSGRQRLLFRGVGLKDTQRQLLLLDNGKLDIELEEEVYSLREVTVTSSRIARVQSTSLGVERMQIREIKNIPTAFGELDVIRVVMLLPGVKSVGEASSGFNVRGGSTDQNLILFNEGTVYNPTHMFGFFSAFNSDVIKEVELYKSSIPAKYGGRISSVLEINGREGNKKEFNGAVSLGLLTSRVMLEGPIGKKTSFILGGRTTYSDWILGLLPDDSGYKDGSAGFYDMNLILDHHFSDRDNLYVSGYYSKDRFSFETNDKYGYRNANASLKWRHIFNQRFTSTFSAGYDHYDYNMDDNERPTVYSTLRFAINQFFGKANFTHYLNEDHTLDFGVNTIYYKLNPGEFVPRGSESLIVADKLQDEEAVESAIHLADRWDISSALSLEAGVRYSMFNVMGPRTYNVYEPDQLPHASTVVSTEEVEGWKAFKTYHNPEFRLSARYAFTSDFSVKAGVNTLSQYIHKLSNTTVVSPTDTWKLSDVNIKPQKGMQVAVGLYKNFQSNTIETSIEGYYKTMDDYLDYRSGAQLMMNHTIETDVITTKGKSYGVELMIKKTQGKLNGWISYAYSKAMLKQDDPRVDKPVNKGEWYPASYDKPHEVKMVANYKFTQRYSVSVNCEYSTGRPITVPTSKYDYVGGEFAYYSERNQYRIPDFFRMDLAINIEPSHNLTLLTHSSISLGVYNLTGRENAYSVYYKLEEGRLKGYKMSIFGAPIPYVSYNIKF
ncbi:TonB-dependent receptor [Parabacteroides sp. OttesenSCG-928-G07]|nr:TonB-dependent receptor [Parabacteroides sp. OttesenSCG-928-G07]